MQKILIVDDVPANIKILIEALKNSNYDLIVATTGSAALKVATSEIPDLIMLDIVMPEMNGYEVCAKLKANKITQNIPIIFITTQGKPENESKGFELGAVDYITKPFSLPIVRARVKTHLNLKLAYDELEKKNAALEEAAALREDVERITRHDLKNPLNGIIGGSTFIVEDDNLTSKQKRMLKIIEESAYKMLGMINRSLDLYKMETGAYHYNPTPVDILPIIKKIITDTQNLSIPKELSVITKIGEKAVTEDDTFIVQGEQLLCYSMLANLLNNALEASPEGEQITISLQKEETANISIHNKGVVPPKIRERFFDKYVTYGKIQGTGLGTYSARLMVETQGGSIHCDTSDETGTTVTVLLQK